MTLVSYPFLKQYWWDRSDFTGWRWSRLSKFHHGMCPVAISRPLADMWPCLWLKVFYRALIGFSLLHYLLSYNYRSKVKMSKVLSFADKARDTRVQRYVSIFRNMFFNFCILWDLTCNFSYSSSSFGFYHSSMSLGCQWSFIGTLLIDQEHTTVQTSFMFLGLAILVSTIVFFSFLQWLCEWRNVAVALV